MAEDHDRDQKWHDEHDHDIHDEYHDHEAGDDGWRAELPHEDPPAGDEPPLPGDGPKPDLPEDGERRRMDP